MPNIAMHAKQQGKYLHKIVLNEFVTLSLFLNTVCWTSAISDVLPGINSLYFPFTIYLFKYLLHWTQPRNVMTSRAHYR